MLKCGVCSILEEFLWEFSSSTLKYAVTGFLRQSVVNLSYGNTSASSPFFRSELNLADGRAVNWIMYKTGTLM